MTQLIGFVAGALTAFAFLPHVLKTRRTRFCGDLSMNTVTLTMCLVLSVFKLSRSG